MGTQTYLPAGTACPPELRRTPEFKMRPRERKPIYMMHHTPAYRKEWGEIAGAYTEATVEVIISVDTKAPITHSEAIKGYLATHKGPVSKAVLAGVIPSGASLRDVLYRLNKRGEVVSAGHGMYALGGAA